MNTADDDYHMEDDQGSRQASIWDSGKVSSTSGKSDDAGEEKSYDGTESGRNRKRASDDIVFLPVAAETENEPESFERVQRRRKMNAIHSKRKRERQKIEIEVLRGRCSEFSAENLDLYHKNKKLEELIEKAKTVVKEHKKEMKQTLKAPPAHVLSSVHLQQPIVRQEAQHHQQQSVTQNPSPVMFHPPSLLSVTPGGQASAGIASSHNSANSSQPESGVERILDNILRQQDQHSTQHSVPHAIPQPVQQQPRCPNSLNPILDNIGQQNQELQQDQLLRFVVQNSSALLGCGREQRNGTNVSNREDFAALLQSLSGTGSLNPLSASPNNGSVNSLAFPNTTGSGNISGARPDGNQRLQTMLIPNSKLTTVSQPEVSGGSSPATDVGAAEQQDALSKALLQALLLRQLGLDPTPLLQSMVDQLVAPRSSQVCQQQTTQTVLPQLQSQPGQTQQGTNELISLLTSLANQNGSFDTSGNQTSAVNFDHKNNSGHDKG